MISLTDTSGILPGIHLIASLTIVMGYGLPSGFVWYRIWSSIKSNSRFYNNTHVANRPQQRQSPISALSGARSLFLW